MKNIFFYKYAVKNLLCALRLHQISKDNKNILNDIKKLRISILNYCYLISDCDIKYIMYNSIIIVFILVPLTCATPPSSPACAALDAVRSSTASSTPASSSSYSRETLTLPLVLTSPRRPHLLIEVGQSCLSGPSPSEGRMEASLWSSWPRSRPRCQFSAHRFATLVPQSFPLRSKTRAPLVARGPPNYATSPGSSLGPHIPGNRRPHLWCPPFGGSWTDRFIWFSAF